MKICPNCGYERTSKDDNFISVEECPKCGIFYKKWEPSDKSKSSESVLENDKALNSNKKIKSIPYKSIVFFVLISMLLAFIAKFTFFTQKEMPRVVSTLPVVSPTGMESSSYLIYASGNEETITAAGQIFKPPNQTPVLFKIGFYFTQSGYFKRSAVIKLQIILSEWSGDRPGRKALWVSDPIIIKSTDKDVNVEWLDFNVPNVALNPGRMYVAWVTLSSLSNQNDASIGIVRMGPRYSQQGSESSPYPQGMCTLYRQENPDGDVSQMINSSWEVNDYGHNLHFKMSFENAKNDNDKRDSENNESQIRLNEIIEQKTKCAIAQRKEREQQKREDMGQQQVNVEIWRQENMKQRQVEVEQRREEIKRQQEEREYQQEERKRRWVEAEIQQYEREQQQSEYNKSDKESGRVQRRYRRR